MDFGELPICHWELMASYSTANSNVHGVFEIAVAEKFLGSPHLIRCFGCAQALPCPSLPASAGAWHANLSRFPIWIHSALVRFMVADVLHRSELVLSCYEPMQQTHFFGLPIHSVAP
ncbi:predicted protein [Histoplasma capsulatum G186AR]|uniref:Uncharacterized protein n=1 Tax=Ajellomyces capsulatus (strain G186AR / H82 / ATCC MYA-2454 / RMSCC 2432) TaxID=447093 RepID=C0NT92_AJECG|nr:uncharacterized protein HCBG_06372 [Histoplasma capsulatum G186AR]EEH05253.1 predicted protein [Histoplasma capsulatum G186AR]